MVDNNDPLGILGEKKPSNNGNDPLGILKKKETTVSPSVQKPAPISSGTQPKVTQKPSATSVSGKPEGLYSFPGNTLAVFKKTADGWYVDNTRSGNFIKLQKGDVEKRTAALEKQAQTLYDKDYEKSLSWKWEKQPEVAEPKKQQTNEQKQQQELFKNTFKALKEDDPIVIEKENVSKLSKDVSSYVDKSEGETVEDLTNKFKNTKYDIFNFEETGVGDMLKVTNKKTGQNITIDLDGSENEKKILESFIESNLSFREYNNLIEKKSQLQSEMQAAVSRPKYEIEKELSDIDEKIKEQEFYRKGYALSKGTFAAAAMYGDRTVKNVNEQFNDNVSRIIGNSVILKEEIKKNKEYDDKLKSDYSKGIITKDQYDNIVNSDLYKFTKDDLSKRYKDIIDESKTINDDRDLMEKTIAESRVAKEERGDIGSNLLANFAYGFVSPVRMLAEIDAYNKPVYDSKGNRVFDTETLSKSKSFQDLLPGVITDEYMTSSKTSDLEKALAGVAESLGAAIAVPVPGAGAVAAKIGTEAAKRTGLEVVKSIAKKSLLSPQQLGLFASSYMNFKDQINSDPSTEKIDEADKVLLSGAYAYVSSKLESFGMSKWFSKTPAGTKITSFVVAKAFKDLPKNASQEAIDNAINSSVKGLIAKGAISLTGTTEALQELADIGVKYAYNELKGNEVFKNPSYGQIIDRMSESYKLGLIGGVAMSSTSQIINTAKEARTALQINQLEQLISDPNVKKLFEDDIKTKILSGQITKEQGKNQIDELNDSISLLDEIPNNVKDKTQSFKLLSEKRVLEKEIAGKDENLVSAQKARIADINNELKTISENATKESNIEEVTAEGGGLQREGVNEGQPEVGQGEGPVGQAAQPETDLGNRPIEGGRTEEARVETIDVYHGGSMDEKTGDIYVTEDKNQATEYAKGNEGNVIKYSIPKDAIASEQDVTNAISELGVDVNDESRLYELIDPRFEETYIGDDNKQKLFDSLKNKGFEGASFIDEDLSLNEKQGVKNIVVFEAEKLSPSSVTVKENEAENLYDKGYRPVVDGQIKLDYNKENIGDLFEGSERIEMSLPTEPTVAEEAVVERPVTEQAQKITTNIEQKINEYEAEQESKGIGTEETVTTDAGKEITRTKLAVPKNSNTKVALAVDTGNSPRAAVLKYFVGGGKINSIALQKLFGDKQGKSIKGETQSRIGLIDNKKGKTIEQISEYLWSEYGDQFNMNDQDFIQFVEEVISEFKGTKAMTDELLSYENKSEEDYYKQKYGEDFEGYDTSELEDAESVLDYMTDEEIIQMANDIEAAEKQFAEQPAAEETIESLKALDVTDKTNLQKIQSFLDKLDNDLDKFGKETLGVNLPVAVAKAVIKTLKSLVNAGVSLEQALKQASEIHNVSEVDIVESFEKVRKKETEASKAAKKISKPTQKKVIVNEAVALRDQLRLEARAARESAMDLKRKQRALVSVVNGMKRNGSINVNQATALAKRIVNTNLDNPVMVDRMLNYAERLFKRADYQEVLKNAFGLRNKIRKAGKSKDKLQAEVAGMAKKFTKIDPSLVEDIDMYMEMAEKVYNAVRPVRLIKTGLVTKIAADIAQIAEYQTEEIKRQEEILKNEAMNMHKYLVDSGAITSEMSLKEIKDVITILENNPEADVTDRESIIRDYVKKAFDVYSGIIIDMVKTGVDPMTGEEISFDEKQKDIIKRLIGIDTDFMKLEDAYKSIEALDNFIVNKITSGVEAIVNSYEGKLNAEAMERSGIKTRSLKLFFSGLGGRFFAEYFASLPVLIDTMFAGINAGQRFMNLSGLYEFANGVAKATREQYNMINEYGQKFEKSRPNGMDFRAAENVYERGIIAYLSRTIDGNTTQQREELGRRINIVKDSIEALSKGDKDQRKMSEIYQLLYDKLGLDEFNKNNDNLTISDIQSRADKTNLEATNWWIGKWAEKYSDLADVSLSVYNTELGSDINYTPDRYSKVEGEESPIEDVNLQKAGAFGMDLNFTDKNKTGVLMETTRPKKTPGRYVNLDFDISNARSMKAALVDINTAASVRKIDGFLRSPSMNKIIEDTKDKQILQRRINSYIRRSKHKAVINDATLRELDSAFNYVASIGAVKALGGIFQPIKQTMPVMVNTIINAGPQNMSLASVLGDSDMHEWINNSGMAIANRGMEASTTVETANKYLDKVAGSKGEALGKGLMKINEFWLKKFLQQPDVWIARSSFISYYKQALRRKGVDVSKIDWKNHPVDKEAANYAQHMVDRQQNVSDAAMMGEIMASESGTWKIARKTLLPFANFIMNQKSRMYSDFRTAASSEASKEDKIAALRSLSGLTIELASYQYIGYLIGMMIKSLAANLVGYEPDDEEEEKNKKYAVQNASNQYIKDVLSPLPLTDGATLKAFDFIADQIQDLMISNQEIKDAIDDENKVREEMGDDPMTDKQKEKLKEDLINNRKYKFEDYKNDKLFNLGTLSIALDKSSELWEMTKIAKTGKFTEESYGAEKTKYINKADQKMMAYLSALKFASLSGALPVEANNLAMYSTKYIKKKAMTENQKDMSSELMKEMNIKELKDYQVALIEKKKSVDSVIEEVDWVESNGGLKNKKQQEEYIKILNKNGEVTSEDLDKIQKLK